METETIIAGNKQMIERYYAELWNGWNLDLVDQIIASDIEFRGSIGTTVRGRSEFREYILKIRTAFPDFHNSIKHLVAERDKVVAQMTYTGTHRGELFGMGGTGTKVRYDGIAVFTITDGKITSGFVLGDTLSLKRQITVGAAFASEPLDPHPTLSLSSAAEEEWAANLMSASEPWLTLGRGRAACLEALRNPSYLLFISHNHHGQARGFLLLDPDGVAGSPYIRSVGVDPSCRSSAVGTEMLQFAERLSRRDARHIFLCVSSFNARARTLYERLGYKMVGELKAYVIPGASELLMQKRLRD